MGQQDPVPLQQGADPRGPLHLAVLLSFSGAGGVERMVMNLVRELAAMPGLRLDLLSIRADGPHLTAIPANVRWLPLQAGHTLTAIPALVRYLCREKPQALLVAKDRAGRAALMARQLAGVDCRVVIRLGTNLSAALKNRSGIRRWWRTLPMRWLYPLVDRVVAVSDGVARDTVAITGLPAARVTVIRNPVITPGLLAQAQAPVAHPWLNLKTVPVIMGAGRLSDQKDFLTLLEAFAQVRRQRDCRLMILGEGGLRAALEQRVAALGLDAVVSLPGFQADLPAWLQKADLFVLSSRWEGSPNVLTEALALGVPVVATACPSGPDEVLAQGRFGPLVPVGDVGRLAQAMLDTLAQPLPGAELQQAVQAYRADRSAREYLAVLQGLPGGRSCAA